MFLPRNNDHVFCLLRVGGHEVISSPIEHLVSRKLECRKNIAITCIRHMNTSGSKTEPCGTPRLILVNGEIDLLNDTHCLLAVRNEEIN